MATIHWGSFDPSPALSHAILGVLAAAARGEAVPLVIRLRQAPRDSIVMIWGDNWPDGRPRMVIHPSKHLTAELRERYETPTGGRP